MVFITVGRKVECNWIQEPGTTNSHQDWVFGAAALIVRDYNPGQQAAVITPMTNWRAMQRNSLDVFMIRGGDYAFMSTLTYFYHAGTVHPLHQDQKQGVVRIVSPTVTPGVPEPSIFLIWPHVGPGGRDAAMLRLGHSLGPPGFKFGATVRLPAVAGGIDGGPGTLAFV